MFLIFFSFFFYDGTNQIFRNPSKEAARRGNQRDVNPRHRRAGHFLSSALVNAFDSRHQAGPEMEDFFSFRTLIIRALMLRDRVVGGLNKKKRIGAAVRKANAATEIPQRAKWCGVNRFNVRPAHYANPRRRNVNTSVRKHTETHGNGKLCYSQKRHSRRISFSRNGSMTQENRIHRNAGSAAHPTKLKNCL